MASAAATSTSFHSLSSTFLRPLTPPSSSPSPSSVTFRRPTTPISAVYTTTTSSTSTSTAEISATATSSSSLYEILGIQDFATCREIKAAYRKLARVVHPDAVLSKDGENDATSASDHFIQVHEAYAALSDPHKRADYDRMLMFKRRRIAYSPNYAVGTVKYQTKSSSEFSGYTRCNWETDQCW